MSKKSILAALFLLAIGIVFGAVLVSNFSDGLTTGFAGDEDVEIGAASQLRDGAMQNPMRGFTQVAKEVTPTVVSVNVTIKARERDGDAQDFFHFFGPDFKFKEPPMQGSGSGVVINPSGYILTNNHVVEGADAKGIEVVFSDRRRMKAQIVGTDPTTDLAVIKVDGKELSTAAFGDSDSLEVGEWAIAIGNPLGLQSTVTAGIISAVGRNIGIVNDSLSIESFIQTDAAINPGNSGGPLVNMYGEVIGINTAIATTNARYQGYGFAVPINLARSVAEDLIKHGKVRRGYIGVSIGPVDEAYAKALGLDQARGVIVQQVVPDGAAEEAGIKAGDVILTVDGKEVNAPNQLQLYVARKHPGDEVKLEVFRDQKKFAKTVRLRARTEENITARRESSEADEGDSGEERKSSEIPSLGLSLRALSSDQRNDRDVEAGVLVTGVTPLGEAATRGIQEGDIIIEADKKPLASPSDFRRIIESRKAGDALLLRVKRAGGQIMFLAVQIPE